MHGKSNGNVFQEQYGTGFTMRIFFFFLSHNAQHTQTYLLAFSITDHSWQSPFSPSEGKCQFCKFGLKLTVNWINIYWVTTMGQVLCQERKIWWWIKHHGPCLHGHDRIGWEEDGNTQTYKQTLQVEHHNETGRSEVREDRRVGRGLQRVVTDGFAEEVTLQRRPENKSEAVSWRGGRRGFHTNA